MASLKTRSNRRICFWHQIAFQPQLPRSEIAHVLWFLHGNWVNLAPLGVQGSSERVCLPQNYTFQPWKEREWEMNPLVKPHMLTKEARTAKSEREKISWSLLNFQNVSHNLDFSRHRLDSDTAWLILEGKLQAIVYRADETKHEIRPVLNRWLLECSILRPRPFDQSSMFKLCRPILYLFLSFLVSFWSE